MTSLDIANFHFYNSIFLTQDCAQPNQRIVDPFKKNITFVQRKETYLQEKPHKKTNKTVKN